MLRIAKNEALWKFNDSMTQPIFEVQRSCNGNSVIIDSAIYSIAIRPDTGPVPMSMQTLEFNPTGQRLC
ncbi:hypothetical protein BELL_0079g00070 [Botrytis elliptica]|uniref:Uncharacterized protein n=1 Tax=Botrytis elliptica TaxID=278938 RepID=A0A4Z1JW45_9HELO|nr:hypothetical protein BELL_0079g00070 [Botrytis elliptica]